MTPGAKTFRSRIVMFGTGDFAVPVFEQVLLCSDVAALVTQPDRPQGKSQRIVESPIKRLALAADVPVLQPEDVNTAASLDAIRAAAPDLFVTAAYGQILSGELLSIPRYGGINLHGSLLPKYRGAAPVARAIQNGETETGVTVIRMTPRIDAGGMLARVVTPIDPSETSGELETRLAKLGAPAVIEQIAKIEADAAVILPQARELVTRAPKLKKEDGLIDWTRPATAVHNLVRAMNPWPLAYTFRDRAGNGPNDRLIVHRTRVVGSPQEQPGTVVRVSRDALEVAAGDASIALLVVQLVGKRPLEIGEFLRGYRIAQGDRMVSAPGLGDIH